MDLIGALQHCTCTQTIENIVKVGLRNKNLKHRQQMQLGFVDAMGDWVKSQGEALT